MLTGQSCSVWHSCAKCASGWSAHPTISSVKGWWPMSSKGLKVAYLVTFKGNLVNHEFLLQPGSEIISTISLCHSLGKTKINSKWKPRQSIAPTWPRHDTKKTVLTNPNECTLLLGFKWKKYAVLAQKFRRPNLQVARESIWTQRGLKGKDNISGIKELSLPRASDGEGPTRWRFKSLIGMI